MICNIVGARPNFMKMAPVFFEMRRRSLDQLLIHTGQHYDALMSSVFFRELGMPEPDIDLGIGSGSHADQTARIMQKIEPVFAERSPDLVIVGGDVNSTVACALVAAKMQIPVAHVEAGLRSFDRSMPEEINRVITDHISELLFTTERSANENLAREGISTGRIHFVGNCMIDSLRSHLEKALAREPWKMLGYEPLEYGVVTLHRPSNVDDRDVLVNVMRALEQIGAMLPLIFPVHPRTKNQLQNQGVDPNAVRLTEPLGYLDFLGLVAHARLVLTDSGGIQEETTALGVPCLTMRSNTERPVTIDQGTNRLVGNRTSEIIEVAVDVLEKGIPSHRIPELWDGNAAARIVDVLERWLENRERVTQ